jgi:phage shock protein C
MTSAPLPTPDPSHSSTASPTLRRSGTDRMVGGVAGGLAQHLGIDALLWRVGFVALTLAGGSGILVYLLLWVLMPPALRGPQETVSPIEQQVERLHDAVRSSSLGTGRR